MNPETNVKVRKRGKKRVTRKSFSSKYAGAPSDLHSREPCTLRELINYYYYVKEQNPKLKSNETYRTIYEKVIYVWSLVSESLPLLSEKVIIHKIKIVIEKVQNINNKKSKFTLWQKNLDPILDKLFDICACDCELPAKRPCNDRYLN